MARAKVSLQLVGTAFSADTKQPVNNLGDAVLRPRSPVAILPPCLRAEQTVFCGILKFDAHEGLISNTSSHEVTGKIAPKRELRGDVSWRANTDIEETKIRANLRMFGKERQKVFPFASRLVA